MAEDFDGRRRNRMDDMTREVDQLLCQWGKHARDDAAPRWPRITLLGRAMEQGLTGAAQPGAIPTADLPRPIMIIDWAVASLRQRLRDAIYIEYVRMPGSSREQKAKRAGLPFGQWKLTISRARETVISLYNSVQSEL